MVNVIYTHLQNIKYGKYCTLFVNIHLLLFECLHCKYKLNIGFQAWMWTNGHHNLVNVIVVEASMLHAYHFWIL